MGFLPSPFAILVGIGAGLASALGFAALAAGTSAAFLLFLISPLPIVIACLGWGTGAGIIAVLMDIAFIATLHSGESALAHAVLSPLPAVLLSHLMGMARPATSSGGLRWFPLGAVLIVASVVVAAGCVLTGWLADLVNDTQMHELAREIVAGQPGSAGVDPQVVDALAAMFLRLLPIVSPAVWCGVIIANLWLGAHVTRFSDRLMRPWEMLYDVTLPRVASLVLIVLVALVFMGGTIGLIASPFAGTLGTVHVLTGLAFLHKATLGSALRGFVLSVAWASLILTLPAIILMAVGVVDTLFRLRSRMARPDGSQNLM